jgi:hypothetical protein
MSSSPITTYFAKSVPRDDLAVAKVRSGVTNNNNNPGYERQ